MQRWTDAAARTSSRCSPHTLADVFRRQSARSPRRCGVPEAGDTARADPCSAVSIEIAPRVPRGKRVQRVAFIEWIDPADVVRALDAGVDRTCRRRQACSGLHGRAIRPGSAWDDIAAADPDVILVGTLRLRYCRPRSPRWSRCWMTTHCWQWPCAPSPRTASTSQTATPIFNRPGPRLVESAEILAEVLHPSVCDLRT